MKKLILLCLLLTAFQGFSQYEEETSSLNWLTDLEQAKKEALKQDKPILVYFTGSDWCPPCKSLKKDFFNSDAFEKKADKFVLVMVDMPRRVDIISKEQKEKNKKVVSKYNKSGGYPNIVALDDKGKVLGEISGYTFLRETDTHFQFVDGIIDRY